MRVVDSVKKWVRSIIGLDYVTVERLRKAGAVVGDNVNIYTKKIDLAHAFLLKIGNNVTISDARLLMHDASTKLATGYSKVGRVIIGDNVFIGADAIILPNVKIGSYVIIGAGAIVSSDIPDNSVCVGSPARVIGTYDQYILKYNTLISSQVTFNTHYSQKTPEEIKQMQDLLMDGGIGFDI